MDKEIWKGVGTLIQRTTPFYSSDWGIIRRKSFLIWVIGSIHLPLNLELITTDPVPLDISSKHTIWGRKDEERIELHNFCHVAHENEVKVCLNYRYWNEWKPKKHITISFRILLTSRQVRMRATKSSPME